jgi:hypothetical protein
MPQIHVKNQLNDGLTIDFCCGDKEYQLETNEEIVIDITEDVCLYLDVVRKPSKVLCSA